MSIQLNIKIAKMLGYTMYHYDKDHPDKCYYELWDSQGEPVVLRGERKTETEAWNDAPNWSEDVALALGLWHGYSGWSIGPGDGFHSYTVSYTPFHSNVTVTHFASSVADIAHKLCELWVDHVDPKQLEKDRKIKLLLEKKYALEEELRELDPNWDD